MRLTQQGVPNTYNSTTVVVAAYELRVVAVAATTGPVRMDDERWEWIAEPSTPVSGDPTPLGPVMGTGLEDQ